MVLDIIFGIIVLGIAVFIAVKILGHITLGIVLIGLVLLASYLLIGGLPDLQTIPIIGKYLPKIPRTTGDAIGIIKSTLYNIEILLPLSRDSDNNLLITVANTGKMKVSNFTVVIDDNPVNVLNKPRDPLDSRSVTVIQTDWKEDFKKIIVQTNQVSTLFKLD